MASEPTPTRFGHILKTVQLSSGFGSPCQECPPADSPDFLDTAPEDVAAQVNHYIEVHGYELLHIGQQTGRDQAGNPWEMTVALVGKPREIYQQYS